MSRENWIWMPHAGHLCIGHMCQFRLSTYVNGYVVSTVGEYWPDINVRRCFLKSRQIWPNLPLNPEPGTILHRKTLTPEEYEKVCQLQGDAFDSWYLETFGFEQLGLNRLYESMVFKAKKSDLACCPWTIEGDALDLDFEGYQTAEWATKGHYELCEKWDAVPTQTD